MRRIFGCCRYVYNSYINYARTQYAAGLPHPSHFTASKIIVTNGRRDPATAWLAEAPTSALSYAVLNGATAYDNFFSSVSGRRKGRPMGAPRFKKRSERQAATFGLTNFGIRGHWQNTNPGGGRLRLTKVGLVHVNWHRPLPGPPSSVTIVRETDGTWWASFVVPVPVEKPTIPTRRPRDAGIDVGLADFAAIAYSDGTREKVPNPRYFRTAERKLARAQKDLSRKQKGSRNREKARAALARTHSRVANQRSNHARQLASRLTRENQTVAVETLNISSMAKTRLSKSINDAGWAQFFRYLEEASERRGRELRRVPAGFPSSRTCSICGTNSGKKPLSVRTWVCPHCNTHVDRDYNAAVNILVAAGPAETQNACGGSIRRELARAATNEAGTHPNRGHNRGHERRKPRRRSAPKVEASTQRHPTHLARLDGFRGLTPEEKGMDRFGASPEARKHGPK